MTGSAERVALTDWLGTFPFSHWCTWTFGQKWPTGPSPDAVRRHTQRFLRDRTDVGSWFFVVERGVSGQFRCHSHGLVSPSYPDVGILRQDMWRAWSTSIGRNTVEPLREDNERLRWYVTKYVLKDLRRNLCDLSWFVGDNRS